MRAVGRTAAAVGVSLIWLVLPTATPAAAPAADAGAPRAAAAQQAGEHPPAPGNGLDAATYVSLDVSPRLPARGEEVSLLGQATLTIAGSMQPLVAESVTVQEKVAGRWRAAGALTTDATGQFALPVTALGAGRTYRAVVAKNGVHPATASRAVLVKSPPARSTAVLTVPARVRVEWPFAVQARVTSPDEPAPALGGARVRIELAAAPGRSAPRWRTVATTRTDARGLAEATVSVTAGARLRAVVEGNDLARSISAEQAVRVVPERIVRPASGAPEPAALSVRPAAAVGTGANAVIKPVPDEVWSLMQGRTWQRGCLARSELRYVQVNYFGFDGYRHRGEIVVRDDVARDVASIFTQLYRARYPLRSMVLPDRFGPDARGPGADDYASMAADNTSGFNCRYVVGLESSKTWSPHVSGRAIDVNPWENPFDAATGVFPDPWYLTHRPGSHPAVIAAGGVVVRAFTSHGFAWGGTWAAKDWQHFER